ncbi:hypothetical protein Nepgr_022138 [Nepenthes gracilis]|uniref:Uncharacterized protein n=1 Tax=Nepenthes gracilis TaxID=150966 RepID=A0AAD3T186_NEPGR|nr:hypothetical protein Nepgr_022138 [Nepenthes gracilis]
MQSSHTADQSLEVANHEVYSKGWGGCGSSSTAMVAAVEPCCGVAADPPAADGVEEGASVRDRNSGSEGRKSFSRTKPEGANLTGTYLLSSKNLMYFS